MAEKLFHIDQEYQEWIAELSNRYRQSQIKAAISVNSQMLRFYWSVGQDISERRMENRYGSHFYESVGADLRKSLNLKSGFSATTIKYTKYLYELYSPLFANRQQIVDESCVQNRQQLVDDSAVGEIQLYDADDFENLFSIPWGHHIQIIDKCKGNAEKALFFVRKTLENNWGRGVLLNFLDTDLYESQGLAQTNFQLTLPQPQSDLAQQMLKSPYCFDFLQMGEKYTEKSMKDELVKNIIKFLLELGRGFSFVGQEYHLKAGGKDKYIDLLFYIIPLHCYCVIEVKITEFDFSDAGQLAGYVAMVDDQLNTPNDNPAIGLLICKEKNSVLAKYALSKINSPIGVSEYETAKKSLPKAMQDTLPSIEEIETQLNQK
ncbi:MAG: DUF1016 family protein [Salinivirgaceae bacterium]|nr:DUF1016 family protein [Salinivirgaceae bacterium]MBO7495060.1 DUF1016 family protein [Salinivirgaceae bacterium]